MLSLIKPRLITLIFIFLSAGICKAKFLPNSLFLLSTLTIIFFLLIFLFSLFKKKEIILLSFILFFTFLTGELLFYVKVSEIKKFQKLIIPQKNILLSGLVLEESENQFKTHFFKIKLNKITINCLSKEKLPLQTGDFVQLKGYFKENSNFPENLPNFFVEALIRKIKTNENKLLKFISYLRKKLTAPAKKFLPEPYSSILNSLILGDSACPIPEEIEEKFRKTGLIHLLVASGTQIAIIIASFSWLLKFLKLPDFLKFPLVFILSFFISLITGFGPSIQRAMFMSQLASFGQISGRKTDGLNLLCGASLLILSLNPFTLFDLGFQLSFLACFSLIYLLPIFQATGTSFSVKFKNLFLLAFLPVLCTTPIITFHFNSLSLVAIPANMIILPWIELLIILGALSCFSGLIFPELAIFFAPLNLMGIKFLLFLTQFFSNLPGANLFIPSFSFWIIPFIYFLIVTLALIKKNQKKNLTKIFYYIHIVIFTAFIVFHFVLFFYRHFENQNLAIFSFFDVGQGDSILIQSPNGKKILIDTGGPEQIFNKASSKKYNRTLNLLTRMGINKIDLVVITHPDSDHLGGFEEIAKNLKINAVIDNGQIKNTEIFKKYQKICEQKKIQKFTGQAYKKIKVSPDFEILFLFPENKTYSEKDLKNLSLVFKVIFKNLSLLFTGDIEKNAEEIIIKKNIDLKATILKVAHHGSKSSTSESFLKKVNPKIAIISVGKNNKFGHPHQETINRLKTSGAKIFRTDENGTITIKTEGKKVKIFTENKQS